MSHGDQPPFTSSSAQQQEAMATAWQTNRDQHRDDERRVFEWDHSFPAGDPRRKQNVEFSVTNWCRPGSEEDSIFSVCDRCESSAAVL